MRTTETQSTLSDGGRKWIWRHEESGVAVFWVLVLGRVILHGDSLFDGSQCTRVASAFLNWVKKEGTLSPETCLGASGL